MEISPFLIPIVLFISIPVTIIGVMLARAHTREIELKGAKNDLTPALAKRLDRMEQAMDAIAVEVERIAEGQRFVTKVLAERSGSGLAVGAGHPPGGTT